MSIPESEVRRAVANIIQPTRRGKFQSIEGLRATLGDLIGFAGSHDGFMATSPFGFVGSPTRNTFAYFNNLNGDVLAPIITGWQHQKRPDVSGIGGSIVYSTDILGETVRSFVELFNSGKIVLDAFQMGKIEMLPTGSITMETAIGSLIQLTPLGKILLGSSSSSEALILGNAFMTLYNVHAHAGNAGAPTGPPLVPMSILHISSKSFTEI